MVLPLGFGHLTVPEQLFVAVNLERVDRGLAPFVGLTAALNHNAQRGADDANDPPDPGRDYALDDAEWAGGSSNGLDAVYGWMYDDGYDSGNLDCMRRDASGCWGHRKGILDDFGSGANLVMGAAVDITGDTHSGDNGGTSMAVTLAVADAPVHDLHLPLEPGRWRLLPRRPTCPRNVTRCRPQIYFNPSCSKCRSALAMLDEHHIEAEVVRYLDVPPTRADLERLMALLGIDDPRLMMRTGEPMYTELALGRRPDRRSCSKRSPPTPSSWSGRSSSYDGRAVIGRPPERVLELL